MFPIVIIQKMWKRTLDWAGIVSQPAKPLFGMSTTYTVYMLSHLIIPDTQVKQLYPQFADKSKGMQDHRSIM